MRITVTVEIRLENYPYIRLDVSLPLLNKKDAKKEDDGNGNGNNGAKGIAVKSFLKLVAEAYHEERESDSKLPELPVDRLTLKNRQTEYDANDDIENLLEYWSNNNQFPIVTDGSESPKKRIKLVVAGIKDNLTVIAGGVNPNIDQFAVVKDEIGTETLCLRRESDLVNILREKVFKYDERLFESYRKCYGDDDEKNPFSIKMKLSDATIYSYNIIELANVAVAKEEEEDHEKKGNAALILLATFLRKKMQANYDKWNEILQKGLVSFDALAQILSIGSDVVRKAAGGFLQGGTVTSLEYCRPYIGSDYWAIKVDSIETDGETFKKREDDYRIFDFSPKLLPLEELSLRPVTDAERDHLTKRGRLFRELAIGNHHKAYVGTMIINTMFGNGISIRADGRVMVDVKRAPDQKSFGRTSQPRSLFGHPSSLSTSEEVKPVIEDSSLWKTPPSLHAFSFRLRKFGLCHIELMSEIMWREDAWSKLVLPQTKKDLIHALVLQTRSQAEVDSLMKRSWDITRLMNQQLTVTDNNDTITNNISSADIEAAKKINNEIDSETDLVPGKGGGCTMLFHGKPGTGKTLTAEAISELLRRPLYTVTVGELGTDAGELEMNLRKILDLAASWKAVILLDEADVFLSQRNNTDIKRNGLVSIFLRTIEYHNGVLILTTNLPGQIDEAFASRIHIQLYYAPLNAAQRVHVWRNFLETIPPPSQKLNGEKNGIKSSNKTDSSSPPSHFDYNRLANCYNLNGRQIRNTFHVARTLACQKKVQLSQELIEEVIEYCNQQTAAN